MIIVRLISSVREARRGWSRKQGDTVRKRTARLGLALLAVLALALAGCASEDAVDTGSQAASSGESSPGVTDSEITFGMATPLTGNASSLGIDGQKGAEVFIKWLNDQGGTNGRKWKLVAQDDGFDLQKKATTVQYLIQQEQVFGIWGDVGSTAVSALPLINEQKVPYLFPYALAKQMIDPVQPYVFMDVPMADMQEHALSDWIADNEPGDHKIGLLTLNSADGGDAVSGFKAGKAGKYVVGEQQYERTATSWQPQLVALRSAGVTDIVIHGSDVWTAKILTEAKGLGMTDVQFYGSSGSVTPQVFALAGDAAEGLRAVAINAPSTATDVPGVKEFTDAFAKYEPGYKPGVFALHSWSSGLILAAGMKGIQGDTVTRDGLVASLEKLKNFDTKGITAPVSFTKDNHEGVDKVMLVQGKGGQWVTMTGFIGTTS